MKLLISLGLAAIGVFAQANSVAHLNFVRGKARYHALVVDMSAGQYALKTVLASNSTKAWSMIGKDQPLAAITGTFFDTSSAIPVADVLVDGELHSKGNRGSCLAVDYFGAVTIFDENYRRQVDWGTYQYGLRGAVRVVSNGKVNPDPKSQRFRDRAIWGRAARTGVGLTKSGKLVLIATGKPVTLSEFGRAMVSVGIKNGLSLDGGSSTCLYYKGQMLLSPRRRLSNLLVVTNKPADFAPAPVIASQPAGTVTNIATVTPVQDGAVAGG